MTGVAPLAGSVDRNLEEMLSKRLQPVAPLAGSVDRNHRLGPGQRKPADVAPLAGSVDRNWRSLGNVPTSSVAPLAGSVDRNDELVDRNLLTSCRSPRGERG